MKRILIAEFRAVNSQEVELVCKVKDSWPRLSGVSPRSALLVPLTKVPGATS